SSCSNSNNSFSLSMILSTNFIFITSFNNLVVLHFVQNHQQYYTNILVLFVYDWLSFPTRVVGVPYFHTRISSSYVLRLVFQLFRLTHYSKTYDFEAYVCNFQFLYLLLPYLLCYNKVSYYLLYFG